MRSCKQAPEGIQWLSVAQCGTLQLNIYRLGSVSAGITSFACAPWILQFEVRLIARRKLVWMVLFDAGKDPALTKAGLVTPQFDAIRQVQPWPRLLTCSLASTFMPASNKPGTWSVQPRGHRHNVQS